MISEAKEQRFQAKTEELKIDTIAGELGSRSGEWMNQEPGAWERDRQRIMETTTLPLTMNKLYDKLALSTKFVNPEDVGLNRVMLSITSVLENTDNPHVSQSGDLARHMLGAIESSVIGDFDGDEGERRAEFQRILVSEVEGGGGNDTTSYLTAAEIALETVRDELGSAWPTEESMGQHLKGTRETRAEMIRMKQPDNAQAFQGAVGKVLAGDAAVAHYETVTDPEDQNALKAIEAGVGAGEKVDRLRDENTRLRAELAKGDERAQQHAAEIIDKQIIDLQIENQELNDRLAVLEAVEELMRSWEQAEETAETQPVRQKQRHQYETISPARLRVGQRRRRVLERRLAERRQAMSLNRAGNENNLRVTAENLLALIKNDYRGMQMDKDRNRGLLAVQVVEAANSSAAGLNNLKNEDGEIRQISDFEALAMNFGWSVGLACGEAGTQLRSMILDKILNQHLDSLIDTRTGEVSPFYQGFFEGASLFIGDRMLTGLNQLREIDLVILAATRNSENLHVFERGLAGVVERASTNPTRAVRAVNLMAENLVHIEDSQVGAEEFADRIIAGLEKSEEKVEVMARLMLELSKVSRNATTELLLEKMFTHTEISSKVQSGVIYNLINRGDAESLQAVVKLAPDLKHPDLSQDDVNRFGNNLVGLEEIEQQEIMSQLTEALTKTRQEEIRQNVLWKLAVGSLKYDRNDGDSEEHDAKVRQAKLDQLGLVLVARATDDYQATTFRSVLRRINTATQLQVIDLGINGIPDNRREIRDLEPGGLNIGSANSDEYLRFIEIAKEYFDQLGVERAAQRLTVNNISGEVLRKLKPVILSESEDAVNAIKFNTIEELERDKSKIGIDVWLEAVGEPFLELSYEQMQEDAVYQDRLVWVQDNLAKVAQERKTEIAGTERVAIVNWVDGLAAVIPGGILLKSDQLVRALAGCEPHVDVLLTTRRLLKDGETLTELNAAAILANRFDRVLKTAEPPTTDQMAFIAGNIVMKEFGEDKPTPLLVGGLAVMGRRWLTDVHVDVVVGEAVEFCEKVKLKPGDKDIFSGFEGEMAGQAIGGVLGTMVKRSNDEGVVVWNGLKKQLDKAESNSAAKAGLVIAAEGVPRNKKTTQMARELWESQKENSHIGQALIKFISWHADDSLRENLIKVIADTNEESIDDFSWNLAVHVAEQSGDLSMLRGIEQAIEGLSGQEEENSVSERLSQAIERIEWMDWMENLAEKFDKGRDEADSALSMIREMLDSSNRKLQPTNKALLPLLQAANRQFDLTPLEMGDLLAEIYGLVPIDKLNHVSQELKTILKLQEQGRIEISESKQAFLKRKMVNK